jgi:hypothetical protein
MKLNGTNQQNCFSKIVPIGDTIHIQFLVTGDSSNEITSAKLFNPQGEIIYTDTNSEEGEHEYDVEQNLGTYSLCFYPPANVEHYLSLEFYTKNEKGHLVNMAKDSNYFLYRKPS